MTDTYDDSVDSPIIIIIVIYIGNLASGRGESWIGRDLSNRHLILCHFPHFDTLNYPSLLKLPRPIKLPRVIKPKFSSTVNSKIQERSRRFCFQHRSNINMAMPQEAEPETYTLIYKAIELKNNASKKE